MNGHVDCDQQCDIPDSMTMTEVPPPRHAWPDVVRCPNEGCGRAFLLTKASIDTSPSGETHTTATSVVN